MYRNTVDDWNVWFWGGWRSRDFNCSGFIVILCKVSWNAFLHERWTGIKNEIVGRNKKEGKDEIKRWFGIYNLAWQNTVTSRQHINLCKSPYISPAFPLTLQYMQPWSPLSSLLLQMKHKPSTQADRSCAQKKKKNTDKHFSADWQNKHTLFRRWLKQERTKKQPKHTLSCFHVLFLSASFFL